MFTAATFGSLFLVMISFSAAYSLPGDVMRRLRTICICGLIVTGILLSGCKRTVSSPSDEIRLYSWSAELDNGNTATLRFKDDNADFKVNNKDFSLDISGYCHIEDDSISVYDNSTEEYYRFIYTLHGDSLELGYMGGTIKLSKII